MKAILLKDVPGTGLADTIVNVSDGHARNLLFPKKLATPATPAALRAMDERIKAAEARKAAETAVLRETAAKIDNAEITIQADAGESGKLFGSVTHAEIAEKIRETLGVDVDKKKIAYDESIKTIGTFEIPVKFGHEVTAKIRLNVTARS